MGLLDRLKNVFKSDRGVMVSKYKLLTDEGGGYYSWGGNLYQSDIVRSAIRPKARAIGKAVAKHIREDQINPDVYMRFLLEEPNPYMTGQMLQEKMITQLELNNNAFAYVARDENDYPMAIYPITANNVEAIQDKKGVLYLKFWFRSGNPSTFRYSDIIHLRKDYHTNEIFGDSPAKALAPLMEIVNTTDQGIVKAIKNSNMIKWLLKYNASLRAEDIKKQTKQFVDDYLSLESDTIGAAATDAKADAIQVDPKDYVPNAIQMDKTTQRILSFFNTNLDIIQGNYDEDKWISYYESAIEPDIIQLSGEYTRKLFTRRERGHGNKIIFESSNLNFASMQTKLNLVSYVDRAIMTPNEVRAILNLAPREGGDDFVLRKDTGFASDRE